jgi:hypothetical protein
MCRFAGIRNPVEVRNSPSAAIAASERASRSALSASIASVIASAPTSRLASERTRSSGDIGVSARRSWAPTGCGALMSLRRRYQRPIGRLDPLLQQQAPDWRAVFGRIPRQQHDPRRTQPAGDVPDAPRTCAFKKPDELDAWPEAAVHYGSPPAETLD